MLSRKNKVIHKLRNQFGAGFLATVPISISLYLVYWLFTLVDSLIGPLLKKLMNGYYFYGIGFIVLILLIWLIGIITSGYFGAKLVKFQEKMISKIPVLGTVFKTIRQLSHSVLMSRKDSFSQAVLVEVFQKGTYSIGFVTCKKPVEISGMKKKLLHVFVPTAPNPTSGFLLLVEDSKCINLEMSVEEAFKTVVSAGMVNAGGYQAAGAPPLASLPVVNIDDLDNPKKNNGFFSKNGKGRAKKDF